MLYVDLDCGPLCESITGVTTGYKNAQVSHVGLLMYSEELSSEHPWRIIEAIGDRVQDTSLEDFFSRSPKDRNDKEKIMVGRIKEINPVKISKAIDYSIRQLGKPYDSAFELGEDAFYCSELIYFAFDQEYFSLNPMSFKYPYKTQVHDGWNAYFEALNIEAPEGEMGINPGAMSRHSDQEIIAIYGLLDKIKL